MQSPDSITTFLANLGQVWQEVPDLRFGQLLENIIPFIDGKTYFHADIFHVEDDKWEKAIRKFEVLVEDF